MNWNRFDLCDEKGLLMEAPKSLLPATESISRQHHDTSRHLWIFVSYFHYNLEPVNQKLFFVGIVEDDVVLAAEELRYAASAVGKI
jgi:hypothetical protein